MIQLLCNAQNFWSQNLGSTSFNQRRHQASDSLLGLVQQPHAPLLPHLHHCCSQLISFEQDPSLILLSA